MNVCAVNVCANEWYQHALRCKNCKKNGKRGNVDILMSASTAENVLWLVKQSPISLLL